MAIVNTKKLNNIRDNYPKTWEWMRHKASWEHMCMGAVLDSYEKHIDEMMECEIHEDRN